MTKSGNDHQIADLLKKRYILALSLIAVLTISGQVTRPLLEAYRDDAAVMNLAGRQQMLSLQLTQSALAIDEILDHCFGAGSPPNVDCDSLEEHVDGLRKTLGLWDRSHSRLMQRDSEQGLSGDNSSEIVSLLEKIEPHYRAMHEAAERMLGILDVAGPENPKETMIRPYLRTMTAHESSFLTGMQDVVMQYEVESQARETREIFIDWGLTLAILVSLVATGLMLFAPAIRVIRTQFAQLDESRSQFRRAILDAPFPIMIHAEDGEILQLNKTWTELTGYTLEDIPSIPDWTSKAYGEHKQAVRADIDKLYHLDERVSEGEYHIAARNGKKLIWEFGSTPLGKLPDGRRSVISIAVDVTHRNQIAAALAEASAREKAILASIPDIIVEVNNNKEYTWSNRAGYDFFGDELLGKKAEYYFEGEQEPYDLANPLFGKDDSVIYVENWQRRRDGEKRLLAWWRQALKDTDGHVIGALSTARDITDRKRTEEQLRAAHDELEARVAERTTELLGANTSLRREIADRERAEESARLAAAMMNHMADGVQLTRAETGEIVFANPRFEEMFGYGPGELNGKPVSILNAPSEKSPEDTAAEIIQSLGQTGKWSGEVCNIRKNGEHFWCAAAVSTFDHATHGTVWVAVHQDVTERKRAEEALRRTQLAVDHSSDAIFRIHEDGHISYVNRSACSRLGYSNAELVMMSIPDISPNYTHEEWPAHWEELKRAGTMIFEARHQRKNGNVFPVEVTTNHHVHEGQEYVWAHVRDITERKRIEEQLRTREAELAHATRLSTIGATVAGLAHELNQPLSAVSTYADACSRMVESGNDDKLVETLDKVAHQAERAGKIVHRVQRFIRKEASLRSPVDLNALIRETLELVDPEGRFDGVSISLKLDDSLPPILADAIQIQQVVVNLVRNAVESMEQIDTRHRTITIQSNAPVDDMVIVTVCDTGTGLEPDAADRLFEAFFTTKSNGMGLGLSVSQTIIQAHGGQLWATQNSDSGTTFHLSLPIERRTTDDNR